MEIGTDSCSVVLDTLAGSGTTADSAIALNREDAAQRRFILVEMADYFDTVLLPGRPPFAPFPTVTNLVNASFCPLAAYHDLMHGISNALASRYPMTKRGEVFHEFIASLKPMIRNGDLDVGRGEPTAQRVVQDRFIQFARTRGFGLGESGDIWGMYLEPWIERKLERGQLQRISSDDEFFFEVTVSSPRLPFPLDGGVRNYPLIGRVDEIDLTNRKLIERTTKGERDDENAPPLKDYQIWLLWKILCELNTEQLPGSWENTDFEDFELVVETPFQDFVVQDNEEFAVHTHWAYAWIDDIGISEPRGIVGEVFENAQCSWENPQPACGHQFRECFPQRYPYPSCRPEIRQTFQPWYRLLLWEQMWKGHLWHYQLLMLGRERLSDLGLIVETRVISVEDNRMELQLVGGRENTLRGYDYCSIIPFGTVFCGLKLNATMVGTEGDRVFLQIRSALPDISEEALLLLSPDTPAPVMKEPVTFLDRQTQSALFRLNYSMGAMTQHRAQQRSLIQLLEAVFGTRRLRRGRE